MNNTDTVSTFMEFTVPTGDTDIKQLITWHLIIVVMNPEETSLTTLVEGLDIL